MTFTIIDKETGHEVVGNVIYEIAKYGGLVVMDIDQFAICEDGSIILLDDCGNFTYCDNERFEIRVNEEAQDDNT